MNYDYNRVSSKELEVKSKQSVDISEQSTVHGFMSSSDMAFEGSLEFSHSPKLGVTLVKVIKFLGRNGTSREYEALFYQLASSVEGYENRHGLVWVLELPKRAYIAVCEALEEHGIRGFPFTLAIYCYGDKWRYYIAEVISEDDAEMYSTWTDLKIIEDIPKLAEKQRRLEKRREYEKSRNFRLADLL